METWGHGDMGTWRQGEMDTWTWRHGDMDMKTWTWRHGGKILGNSEILRKKSNGK